MDGFWLGVACSLPVYFVLDHYVVPWIVDEPVTRLLRAVRSRGRE